MLLVIDIGNTNTVVGIFDRDKLLASWRLTTQRERTVDEYGILCRNLLSIAGIDAAHVTGIAIASVVPPLNRVLSEMARHYFGLDPLFVEPWLKEIGMPVLYNPPHDVGADRIVNGVAAYTKYGGPAIIVDLGTATTFDAVSARGEYLGGAIAPGITAAAESLFQRTARLPRVEIKRPPRIIGTTTVESIQAGLYYGYISMVDGMLRRMKAELENPVVIATGGLASLIAGDSTEIKLVDDNLTLDGLRIIYERCSRRQ